MISNTGPFQRAWLRAVTVFTLTFVLGVAASPAQEAGVIQRGDAVVTGFAGVTPPGADLPPDIHPLDRTFLNPDGVTARVLDLSNLGGGPQGQLADARERLALKARDIGHVFGIAFDGDGRSGTPNIYLSATSVYGLQLVMPGANGPAQRVMTGRAGAEWMPGLFGAGGGPGSIWKVDGRTGAVSLLADIKNGDLANSGAGLGSIAFDPASRHLYVSDLETGLIWRVDLQGRILDTYDHGTTGRAAAGLEMAAYDPAARIDRTQAEFNTEQPETWGFAPLARRVWGLAVEGGRLYYGVAEGPQVWSVGLGNDGAFSQDPRQEVAISGMPAGTSISSILFEGAGVMYVAQRGAPLGNYDYEAFSRPQEAAVQRFTWDAAQRRWSSEPAEFAIGMPQEHRGTLGGVALNYGYDRLGRIDYGRCRQTLWTTGEHLRAGSDIQKVTSGGPQMVHGLQGNYKSRTRPSNEPPLETWFIDYDGRFNDPEAYGHIGNVAIFGPCQGGYVETTSVEVPVWVSGPNLVVEKRCYPAIFGSAVRCVITVRNTGDVVAGETVEIMDATRVLWGPAEGQPILITQPKPDGGEWTCAFSGSDYVCQLPGDLLVPGAARSIEVWVNTIDLVVNGNFGFRNCVTLRHPNGQGKACAEGGTEIVVTKTGPASCAPGQGCVFKIAIANNSSEPFTGDVLISDSMFVKGQPLATPILSIDPPLPCSAAPNALPFSCVANVNLAPGETATHAITIAAPQPGNVWLANCAIALDPSMHSSADGVSKILKPAKLTPKPVAGPGPSCVWVKVPAPVQAPITKGPVGPSGGLGLVPLLPLTPEPVCSDGRYPLANGRCPCPVNAPWNPQTGTCGWRPPVCWDRARLTPSGSCCPLGTVWWASAGVCRPPPQHGCPDPWKRRPDGGCCPGNTRWIEGACRPPVVTVPCRPGEIRLPSGLCVKVPGIPPIRVCPDGRPRLANGFCPPRGCPFGTKYNPRTGVCERITTTQPPPTRPCPGNLVRAASGACLPPVVTIPGKPPIRPLPPCPPRLVRNPAGVCVLPGTAGTPKLPPVKPLPPVKVTPPPPPPIKVRPTVPPVKKVTPPPKIDVEKIRPKTIPKPVPPPKVVPKAQPKGIQVKRLPEVKAVPKRGLPEKKGPQIR